MNSNQLHIPTPHPLQRISPNGISKVPIVISITYVHASYVQFFVKVLKTEREDESKVRFKRKFVTNWLRKN